MPQVSSAGGQAVQTSGTDLWNSAYCVEHPSHSIPASRLTVKEQGRRARRADIQGRTQAPPQFVLDLRRRVRGPHRKSKRSVPTGHGDPNIYVRAVRRHAATTATRRGPAHDLLLPGLPAEGLPSPRRARLGNHRCPTPPQRTVQDRPPRPERSTRIDPLTRRVATTPRIRRSSNRTPMRVVPVSGLLAGHGARFALRSLVNASRGTPRSETLCSRRRPGHPEDPAGSEAARGSGSAPIARRDRRRRGRDALAQGVVQPGERFGERLARPERRRWLPASFTWSVQVAVLSFTKVQRWRAHACGKGTDVLPPDTLGLHPPTPASASHHHRAARSGAMSQPRYLRPGLHCRPQPYAWSRAL